MEKDLLRKIVMISKRFFYGVFINCLLAGTLWAITGNAQEIKSIYQVHVQIKLQELDIPQVFNKIEDQTGLIFSFNKEDVKQSIHINSHFNKATVADVLLEISKQTDLKFKQINNNIHVTPKKAKEKGKNEIEVLLQGITITGKVTSEKDQSGLPGVNVIVKGTSQGTVTDIEGNYKLDVPDENTVLVFSSVGFIKEEIIVGNQTVIDFALTPDLTALDEIVVIGYGYQKKKDLTGSVVAISTEDMNSVPLPSVGDAMQGKAAGVQIISNGTPGSDPTFIIRGISTINNNNPLLVIDGVPTQSGLNQLNMDDVESIQVLKDASATAIYGSRGANGVIIVTSKNGKKRKSQINFNAYYGVQEATGMVDVLNASEFATLHNEMMENAGMDKNPEFSDPASLGSGTDWLGALFTTAPIQNYSLSYSGGNEKSTFYVSGNYFNQEGIIINTGFKRYVLRFNSETQVLDKVKFGNMLSLNHDNKYSGSYDILNTMRALPTQAIYNQDGTYSGPEGIPAWSGDIANPIGKAAINENTTLGYNLIGSIFAEIELIEGLKFRSQAGLQANFWEDREWAPKYNFNPTPQEQSYLGEASNKSITWNWDNTLTYDKTINDLHQLTILAGTSAQQNNFKYINGSIKEFASDLTQQLDNGLSQKNIGGNGSSWSLMSFMGRVNYSLADKYLVTATVRRDGSSRFGTNNKWGTFPSGSLGWRISEEKFMQSVGFINDMKLRAGYGVTGNQEIGNYSFASALSTIKYNFSDNLVNGVVPIVMPNPNVQWESQKQSNIGLDATIVDQRINIAVDAYIKNTENMLVPMAVPITTGYSDIAVPFINAGEVMNKGIEVNVTSFNLKGDFTWDTDFNISFNKNEVVSLNDTIPLVRGSVGFNQNIARIEAGRPIDIFYGFVTDGIFQNQEEVDLHALQVPGDDINARTSLGDIRYKDLNSDGIIDDEDRTYIGNPNPDLIFALNNRFTYKGFDFNIFLLGVYGGDIYNANRIWSEGMAVAQNQNNETVNRWTVEGTNNTIPRAIFNDPNKNNRPSNRFVEDGSFLRIRNVTLGYSFPTRLIEKFKMNSVRLYVSGVNLMTFTKYQGFDPEVGTYGIDLNTYPITRNISIGANISF